MYQALYRKWRPKTFSDVVGQEHVTETLQRQVAEGRLSHAYLFTGTRGTGKTTCAKILAKAVNCEHPENGNPCNKCSSCLGIESGGFLDVMELDAASNNGVDHVRALRDEAIYSPAQVKKRVYIIDEVHMLSLQAFNAFLKTLEEPPAHAVFILATTEKHKIIPTILSRCQIYDFNRIRVEDGVEYLKYIASQEGVTYDDESLHIIAQKADGGMRDALSMFDKVVSFCGSNLTIKEVAGTLNVLDYDTYFTITQQILAGNYTEALLLFDDVLRKGFSGQTFVAGLNNHFRDLLMCKNPQTLPLLEVTGSVAERYKTQAAECSVPLLFEGINLLTAIDSGLRTATNQRLHVELGLMKLCGLGQKKNSDALTPSLPVLERRDTPGMQPAERTAVPETSRGTTQITTSQPITPATVPAPPTTTPMPSPPTTTAATPTSGATPRAAAQPAIPATPVSSAASTKANTATGLPGGISLSGRSISSILQAPVAVSENMEEEEGDEEPIEIDEDTETALIAGCARFSQELMQERPRMGVLFQDARVSGNCINLTVPNESSYDELMHSLAEMKYRLGELSGLRVPIEFNVTIKANPKGLKPIKVEDRLRYLTDKNPLLTKLRKELELDVE